MRKTPLLAILFSVLCLTLMFYGMVKSFDLNAHTLLSRSAVGASNLDSFLKSQLQEFLTGVNESIDGRTVRGHIEDGSVNEDSPVWRARNHFHDPTKTWDQAGLTGVLNFGGQSSVIWSQTSQGFFDGDNYAWRDARNAYFAALTNPSDTTRKHLYAVMFRSLGHLIHLVQDAAAPAHTRNDWHLPFNPDLFHTWADSEEGRAAIAASGITNFDPSILGLPQNSLAPVPIARIIDTEKYHDTGIPSAGTDIGIAEYSNANFLSNDTIVSSYQFPNGGSVDPCNAPKDASQRVYLCKNRDGDTGYKLAVASSLHNYLVGGFQNPEVGLDNIVIQDYGVRLFPRAIGYSAGLINYFLRGKIKIEAPDRYAYALAAYQPNNAGAFTKMRFKVSNDTDYPSTTEDTADPGQMWAVVRYRTSSSDLFQNPFASLSEPVYAVSGPQIVTLDRVTPQEVTFDFDPPIPTNAADVSLIVVYKGKLGMEDGAIMVGGKNLFEPDPLDFGDASDYDCYKATLYHAADPTAFPPYNPPTQTQRDVDNPKDGIQDVFGPFTDDDQWIQTFDINQPVPTPSATQFNFKVLRHEATLAGPQYSRFVLLQDRSPYAFSWLVGSHFDVPTGVTSPGDLSAFSLGGIVNDFVVDPATGRRIHRVTTNFTYRGVTTFHIFFFVVGGDARFAPCASASFSLQPSFIRIEGELAPE